MIIIINTFPNMEKDPSNKIRAIRNLLCVHGEGKHILWMPIEVVKDFLLFDGLCSYSKQVLDHLASFVIESRGIHKEFKFHVEIDFDDAHALRFENGRYIIGYLRAADSAYFQKARFLTEDAMDYEMYLIAASISVARNRSISSACDVKLECIPGGGSSTHRSFERLRSDRQVFLCIIDSDKYHPSGPLGQTASKFKSIRNGFNDGFMLEILSHHELENVIPLEILSEVLSDELDGIIFSPGVSSVYRQYADHKNGLTVAKAISDDNKHSSDYWQWLESYDDELYVCRPFGDNLLGSCLQYMERQSTHSLLKKISPDTNPYWEQLGSLVASWGVGRKQIVR